MIIPEQIKNSFILQSQRSVGDFKTQLEQEYNFLIPYLPKTCETIWDIGAGLGGIDVFLSKHYNVPEIYLTDYNIVDDKIFFGFNQVYCAYNNFEMSKQLMEANGITNYLFDDLNGTRRLPRYADIVISLLSCGFHYPVSTYLNEIITRTLTGAVLILDMRHGHDQCPELAPYFETMAMLPYRKWYRYIGVRK